MEPDPAEELTMLGRGPLAPTRRLECFPAPEGISCIELESHELVARCPVTGQPDIYGVTIRYRPAGKAIETKSLKLYLWSWQSDEGIFAEHLADTIAADVAEVTGAHEVQVVLVQNPRGGITLTVTAERGTPQS